MPRNTPDHFQFPLDAISAPGQTAAMCIPSRPLNIPSLALRLLATLLLAGAGTLLFAADTDSDEPISLFDGKTFAGWEGDTKKMFRIEDGAIVGGTLKEPIPHNAFLTTKHSYQDFVLRLKFKLLGEDPNAGVQIRSERIPDHHEMIGYQADMGQNYWGCLYDESRRRTILAQADPELIQRIVRPDDWNTYEIRCEGKRIQLKLNGEVTVDYTEPDDIIKQEGLIGLQIHSGKPSEAWYKDITIEVLGSEESD